MNSFSSTSTMTRSTGAFERPGRTATRGATSPVFADVKRFGEPSASRLVWARSTTGFHPSFV